MCDYVKFQDQDPASYGPEVAQSAKFITEIRYSLLPYLYTLFYRAHVSGTTVIRPLFHESVSLMTAAVVELFPSLIIISRILITFIVTVTIVITRGYIKIIIIH